MATLPDITLSAETVGDTSGTRSVVVTIKVNQNDGAVLFTELWYFSDPAETELRVDRPNLLGKGGVFGQTSLGPGKYHVIVKRTGVTSTGYVRLEGAPFSYLVKFNPPPPPPRRHRRRRTSR